MRQTFEIPLDIPDVTIENVTTNRIGHIEITVKSTVLTFPYDDFSLYPYGSPADPL